MQRKLTVILCADVVGYSGLMERSEAATLERLKHSRKTIFDPRVAAHGGRTFKLMGDGALVEFASVVAAVTCALEIQEATEADEQGQNEERLRYRIGINLGDVMVEGDDIYGDGVNVAARLQTLADPGGVALSRTVRDHVAGKLAAVFEDRGEYTVKNIERPVHVFAVRLHGQHTPPPAPRAKTNGVSICVLPFANMSGDPEQDYFADGISEDIITDLSKVSALRVVSRNTAFTFKAKSLDLAHIVRHLSVTHVLEGSVRKSGNRVRITAQLIDGKTDGHIWAERYDRDLSDIFTLQDEISHAIVGALKLKLLPEEKRAIETRSTTNPEAYELYLMARQYHLRANSRHHDIIIRLCQRAVELDPDYARALALLAFVQSALYRKGKGTDSGEVAADRALSLDPNLAEAHAAKGRVLVFRGLNDEARKELELAVALDPGSHGANSAAGLCSLTMRRFDDAIRYYEKAASIEESDFESPSMLMQAYEAAGRKHEELAAARRAVDRIEREIASDPGNAGALAHGASALTVLGEVERAKDWIRRALLVDPDNSVMRYNLSCALVRLGDIEGALDLLEVFFKAATKAMIDYAEKDSDLDPVRAHPHYRQTVAAARARLRQCAT